MKHILQAIIYNNSVAIQLSVHVKIYNKDNNNCN